MPSFVCSDDDKASIDVGAAYIEPACRGTGLNRRIKRLTIDRAKRSGIGQICFRIDARNQRSGRAVEKLGARLDFVGE